jgi:UDP-glucose 4-epimerase
MKEMKKVLILGASGLVGGRLARQMKEQGYQVRGATRQQDFSHADLVELSWVNWEKPATLERACQGMDAVVHLASPNAAQTAVEPQMLSETLTRNRRLLEVLCSAGVSRLVYLSSIHVHGPILDGRIDENTLRTSTHPYGELHQKMEDLILESRIPAVVLRSTNGVGWPVKAETKCWTLLANDLCYQAARNGSVKLMGHPGTRRDFLALGEILRGLVFAIEECPPGLFLLASGKTRTTGWLAQKVAEEYFYQTGKTLAGVPSTDPEPVGPEFVFAPDKLARAGLRLRDRLQPEISRLLGLCLEKGAPQQNVAEVFFQAEHQP